MVVKRIYNRIPDEPDDRDLYKSFKAMELPESVDLRDKCSEVRDQGRLGACCAFAGCSLIEYYANVNNGAVKIFSPMFVYYILREAQGTLRQDSGGTIRGTLKAMAKKGACRESYWTYPKNLIALYTKFLSKPSPKAFADGLKHQVMLYNRLLTLANVRQALAEGIPVICGIDVYESFESDTVSDTGEIPMPAEGEAKLGGHAIAIYGYRPDGSFICKNSWGKSFGAEGYFFLKPDYLKAHGSDYWVINLVEQ